MSTNKISAAIFSVKKVCVAAAVVASSISGVMVLPASAASFVVTSTADTLTSGTLRWAITEANKTAEADTITFDASVTGTITLTSALPSVSENLTVTGPGSSSLTIDGVALYKVFHILSSKSLTLSGLTLTRGQNVNGGLISVNGTASVSSVVFSSMTGGSASFNDNANSLSTFTNCTFTGLYAGLSGDYGTTPSLAAGITTWANFADTGFNNRTYVVNSSFTNNYYGIYARRFTKIENSTFTSNTYAAIISGHNRGQVYNSSFSNNTNALMFQGFPDTSENMGTDNRLVTGTTFTDNSNAIILNDYRWTRSGNIYDADIVILGSEIAKDASFSTMDFNRVLSHEFGHFLGLDHQFDGPMSIMSYDSVYSLGTYDNNAITELYKY